MNVNELSVSNVVGELVKNSIDARSDVVQVEFNTSFDIRVTDDGCGFDDHIIRDIGERQLFLSPLIQKHNLYGKNGKFLFDIAQGIAEIFIETIRQNSDVRLYKTVNAKKSVYKVYETDRNYKDATVKTAQGSMVVLNTLNVTVGDAGQVKANIVNSVVELALINFDIHISVKETDTKQTLYESLRTKNLFDKFEQFLESQQFFSKIQSVSCEKHDVKVELFLCEDGTSSKAFQFVYFNRSSERDGKWKKIVNKLCKKRFDNDLNAKCPVYLLNISADNFQENQLAFNVIIDNCIRKCVEQLWQPAMVKGSVDQPIVSKGTEQNHEIATCSKAPQLQENAIEDKGVRLGDWIFNNSCENYEQLNQGKDMYRKKICENWVISLDKPKPKDANDSLQSVVIDRPRRATPQDDHLFKKPELRTIKPKRQSQKLTKTKPIVKPLSHVSTQLYKPSQQVKAFNNSGLIRTSKKLILKASAENKRKSSTRNRVKSQVESRKPTLKHSSETRQRKSLENLPPTETPNRMDGIPNISFEDPLPHVSFEKRNDHHSPDDGLDDELSEAFKLPFNFTSHRNTVDFRWCKQTTNFNMNFSSSIAVHTMNDPFMDLLDQDAGGNNSIRNLFESDGPQPPRLQQQQSDMPARTQTQNHESNRPSGSVYSETSELRYQHRHRNDSVHTHYRQQRTCRNFVSDNSSLNWNRSGTSSGEINRNGRPQSIQNSSRSSSGDIHRGRPKSIQSSSHSSGTAVVPIQRQHSTPDPLKNGVCQSGWPVTININFGPQPK